MTTVPEGFKTCRGPCGETKPLAEFHNDKNSKDGKTHRCKMCNNAASNARAAAKRAEDPNWNTAYLSQWRLDHLDRYPVYRQTWRDANEQRFHDLRLQWRYGLSLDEYYELLTEQNGGCGICKIEEPFGKSVEFFHVDHDHACCDGIRSCGFCVRGLLCGTCNAVILPSFEREGKVPRIDFAEAVGTYLEAYVLRREAKEYGQACG